MTWTYWGEHANTHTHIGPKLKMLMRNRFFVRIFTIKPTSFLQAKDRTRTLYGSCIWHSYFCSNSFFFLPQTVFFFQFYVLEFLFFNLLQCIFLFFTQALEHNCSFHTSTSTLHVSSWRYIKQHIIQHVEILQKLLSFVFWGKYRVL